MLISALTTRELGRMIERAGIQFNSPARRRSSTSLWESTPAQAQSSAQPAVLWKLPFVPLLKLSPAKSFPTLDFVDVRGTAGIKEATYEVAGMNVKVAVASGLANAKELLEKVEVRRS